MYSNSEVFSLKKHKNKLEKYLSTYSPTDMSNFKTVNKQLRNLTHNLENNYKKQLIQNTKSKPKAFWQYINSKPKTCPNITELFRSDSTAASSDTDMANILNDYFSGVFTCKDNTFLIPCSRPN